MGDHRIDRARERYGVELTHTDLAALERQIAENRSVVCRRTEGGETHLVRHRETALLAVWGGARPHIITFLPPQALRSGASRAHYGLRGLKQARRPKLREGGRR